ncbi:hypothetical protein [Natronococcus jeotgali]|uniref:Uncharacterized protein n=1 Tax=Natronococcus jeotgali DSM 18795 TaxID=1227498 RepID=L9XX43_9EURY|nr:hypothetical protein [Natronococcus jeotgali]ELY66404.1 hypothetical protein C492_00729 [Natronococcus jeotgali DSM 18795]
MSRRGLLAALGTVPLAGCSLPALCARPSFRDDRLEFETRQFSSVGRLWHDQGAILATRPEQLDRFEPPAEIAEQRDAALASDERAFLEETAFGESFVVDLLVASSGQSSDARVTHVVREGDRVHCYVCIRRKGRTDDLAPQGRLVRVAEPWDPEGVRVTFTDGRESTETFDVDGTGAEIAGR